MKKFEELMQELKTGLNNLITAESPKELIDKVAGFQSSLDELSNTHSETTNELHDMKDLYIKAIKTSGSPQKPNDDPTPNNEPKSLEEIAKAVLAKK